MEFGGLVLWRHAPLVIENRHTLLVLAQSGGAAAGPGMQPHQLAMGRLVKRIEGQSAPQEFGLE